eukprot:6247063-Pyramimonas_sp.AAC.1
MTLFLSGRRPARLPKYKLKVPSPKFHDPCQHVMLLPRCHCTEMRDVFVEALVSRHCPGRGYWSQRHGKRCSVWQGTVTIAGCLVPEWRLT